MILDIGPQPCYTQAMTSTWSTVRNDPDKAEKYRQYQREYRKARRAAGNPLPSELNRSSSQKQTTKVKNLSTGDKKQVQKDGRVRLQALDRLAVFSHYGMSCVRCGESDPVVLTIDHTDQDGHKHKPGNRKRRISGYQLYRWLVRNNFPDGYRTACANCQIRFYREFKLT